MICVLLLHLHSSEPLAIAHCTVCRQNHVTILHTQQKNVSTNTIECGAVATGKKKEQICDNMVEVNNQQLTSTCAGLHKSNSDVLSECIEVTVTENVH